MEIEISISKGGVALIVATAAIAATVIFGVGGDNKKPAITPTQSASTEPPRPGTVSGTISGKSYTCDPAGALYVCAPSPKG